MNLVLLCALIFIANLAFSYSFLISASKFPVCIISKTCNSEERVSTALFAHHVQKKAIRGVMDKQPRKSRPSDINRRNINHNKCITRVPQGPDYTFAKDLTPEEFAIKLEQSRRVWDDDYNHEDSDALRIDLIPEDFVQHITPNYGPVPKRLRQPDPRLPKSGTF